MIGFLVYGNFCLKEMASATAHDTNGYNLTFRYGHRLDFDGGSIQDHDEYTGYDGSVTLEVLCDVGTDDGRDDATLYITIGFERCAVNR